MTKTLVVVNAGTGDPSSTRLLADRTAQRVAALAAENGHSVDHERVDIRVIDLREIAAEVTTALVSQHVGPDLRAALDAVAAADGIIAATPVYAAGPSGLFTSFFQVLETDSLIGTPVVLAATAGTGRHALVADDQMRGMFGYLRAMTVPTALFAAPEDWADAALTARIDRAARELVTLMTSGVTEAVRRGNASRYQTQLGSPNDTGIRLDSDLMRLAAGGGERTGPRPV
ncbi:CE1759 family FMN reductase [Pseudolysinimonas sp.]|uniref:CE1759 family FMN reductase n=1 Tax=Pseudolysinimonas sp. TaxID=2680009 RepID=UPI00286AE5CE|nr:CE1759 family FMN reductase [Pseudolysinimonas sp.]